MSVVENIRNQSISARKARDEKKSSLFVTLLAEVERVGKDAGNRATSDEEAYAVIRKFIKGSSETLAVRPGDEKSLFEMNLLSELLPAQMSDDDLRAFVKSVVDALPAEQRGNKAVGVVMARLKSEKAGNYDGKRASEIVKEVLSS